MILTDYSQIMVAGCLAMGSDFDKGADTKKMEQIGRHVILNTLLYYKKNYGPKYGNMIICCDGGANWRKDYFPLYKQHRASGRKESKTDWSSIHSIGDTIRQEIMETFPFKVVREDTAEGDDVIATLVKYTQDNETVMQGLEESPQKVLVVSSDGDFKQLYKYRNYSQWSPIQKKAVGRPEKTFLLEKILHGDTGDGIPNVRSPDDIFIQENVRQASVSKKFIANFLDKPDGSTLNEIERAHFIRNKTLIDFECIPLEVSERILNTYKTTQVVRDKNAVFEYMNKNRLRQLTSELHEFF